MRTIIRLASLCLVLLSLPLLGQEPDSPPAPRRDAEQDAKQQKDQKDQKAVLRVTTRLVQLNVIVQDGEGRPVEGLTKDDFRLFDKGHEQEISVFSMESTRNFSAPQKPLPPNTYSNRFEQQSGVPTSVTVILLDALNTRFADVSLARIQIGKFLSQIQPQDRVAIYALSRELWILHDFTNDSSRLQRALGGYRPDPTTKVPAPGEDAPNPFESRLTAAFEDARERMRNMDQIDRVLTTAEALKAIAHHLARLPGRKNLIWLSASFPYQLGSGQMSRPGAVADWRKFGSELESAARAMNDANIAVYPVDARGLMLTGLMAPNLETMNTIADRTGGRAFYATNDIQGSLRRALDDSQVTYVLGFYPAHGQWDGKFHDISVRLKRGGLHLHYRKGYFAMPEETLSDKEKQALLRQAEFSPLESTSLGITAHVSPVDGPDGPSLKAEVKVDGRDLSLEPKDGRWIGAIEVVLALRDRDGNRIKGETTTVNMRLTEQTHQLAVTEGLVVNRTLPLVAGAAELRIVVRDTSTGSIGSVSVPLDKLFSAQAH